ERVHRRQCGGKAGQVGCSSDHRIVVRRALAHAPLSPAIQGHFLASHCQAQRTDADIVLSLDQERDPLIGIGLVGIDLHRDAAWVGWIGTGTGGGSVSGATIMKRVFRWEPPYGSAAVTLTG